MVRLAEFPITRKWPAEHPERIQLYSLPTPNGVKVSVMLEETGLAYEPHLVRFEANEQSSPEFLSLNPNGKIPAIIDPNGPGGAPLPLFESGAILLYLADKAQRFIPQTAAGRYETIQWLMFQMSAVGPMFGQVGFFNKFAGKDFEDKRPARPLRRRIEAAAASPRFDVSDERRWMMGEEYTIADMAIFPWVNTLISFYEAGDLVGIADFAHVRHALGAFLARPAVIRGMTIPRRP